MKRITTLSLLAIAICWLLSCSKKDDGGNNPNPNNPGSSLNDLEKQIIGSWKLERWIDSNYSYTTLQSVTDKAKPCELDDVFTFRSDKKYTRDRGADTCVASTPYGERDWSIDAVVSYLNYKDGPNIYDRGGYYRKVDDTHFIISSSYYLTAANQGTATLYYKKQ